MIIPLSKLIDLQDDVYACTCAMIKRSKQLTLAGDEELEENQEKIVSTAIDQVLSDKVEYALEE